MKREWTDVGRESGLTATEEQQQLVAAGIGELTWKPPGGLHPFSPASAIMTIIHSMEPARITAIAYDVALDYPDGPEAAHYQLLGIEANHANERMRAYYLDTGTQLVCLAVDSWPHQPPPAADQAGPGLEHACLICRHPLNKFVEVTPDGESTTRYLHTAAYQGPQHQPVPVPRVELDRMHFVCDFCTSRTPKWVYTTDDIQRTAGSLISHYGENWSACQTCAEAIDARDVRRLVVRALSGLPPGVRKVARPQLSDIYRAVFAGLKPGRQPIQADNTTP